MSGMSGWVPHRLPPSRPSAPFTNPGHHVTRLVKSQRLWRDLHILSILEQTFLQQNKTGVFFLLSPDVLQRRTQDIHPMESTFP